MLSWGSLQYSSDAFLWFLGVCDRLQLASQKHRPHSHVCGDLGLSGWTPVLVSGRQLGPRRPAPCHPGDPGLHPDSDHRYYPCNRVFSCLFLRIKPCRTRTGALMMHSVRYAFSFLSREWNANAFKILSRRSLGARLYPVCVMWVLILLKTFSFTAEISWSCTLLSAHSVTFLSTI